MVVKYKRPLPTPEEAMHDLLEEETAATLHTQRGAYHSRGQGCSCGGRGRSCETGDSHESKCTYFKIDSYTTDAGGKRTRTQEGGHNHERIGSQCGLPGQVTVDCVSYKHIKQWWRVKKATATAALATTGDCVSL